MNTYAQTYFDIVFGKYEGLNLVNIKNFDDFNRLMFKDALAPLIKGSVFYSAIESSDVILDVGFGGGFPLLPLALAFPHKLFLGIDARRKKVVAVRDILTLMNIHNAKVYHHRVENIFLDKNVLIVSKAVMPIAEFLPLLTTNKRINVFFYKGPNLSVKESFDHALGNWTEVQKLNYSLDDTEQRILIGFQNKNVPCGTFRKKNLVKLSSII